MLPSKRQNKNGLFRKYNIEKIIFDEEGNAIGTTPVEDYAEYFILRLDTNGDDPAHINACRIAVNAYADAIEATIPKLAADLRARYPLLQNV